MTSQRDEALVEMEARKDAAYLERNQVVAALAKCFPSGVARTAIEGWSEDWHGCVYIDLPTGQASWHFHDSQAYLFADLPAYTKPWDGHDTPEKYRRLAALAASPAAQVPDKWEGAEEWMALAWELCADECGDDACNELVWEGGPIPEPWGERWLKYEDEAKRLIALVRKHVAASPPAPPQPAQPTAQQSHFCLECERLSRELVKAQTAAQGAAKCREDGRCQYAIDRGIEDESRCAAGQCVECYATTPTTSQPLKPCPFCGHEKSEFVRLAYIVECCACGCRHESSGEGDLNGQSWNERAQTTQPEPFSDEDIMKIAREAAAGGAFRRDGSTSLRVGRAIESATADAWRSHLAARDAEVAALREQIAGWIDRVNTLAALGIKAERYQAGIALKTDMRAAIDRAGGARDGA